MLVDDSVVQLYYGQVAGAQFDAQSGGVVFPCDSSLPDLQIAVGDSYMATISGDLMNFSSAGGRSNRECLLTFLIRVSIDLLTDCVAFSVLRRPSIKFWRRPFDIWRCLLQITVCGFQWHWPIIDGCRSFVK